MRVAVSPQSGARAEGAFARLEIAGRGAAGGAGAGAVLSLLFNGVDPVVLACFAFVGAVLGAFAWGMVVYDRVHPARPEHGRPAGPLRR